MSLKTPVAPLVPAYVPLTNRQRAEVWSNPSLASEAAAVVLHDGHLSVRLYNVLGEARDAKDLRETFYTTFSRLREERREVFYDGNYGRLA